jgi:hypothetical protein
MATFKKLLSGPVADPNDSEFDGIRADLGRLFIRHKGRPRPGRLVGRGHHRRHESNRRYDHGVWPGCHGSRRHRNGWTGTSGSATPPRACSTTTRRCRWTAESRVQALFTNALGKGLARWTAGGSRVTSGRRFRRMILFQATPANSGFRSNC